jgi:hypothetical protein
VRKKTAMQRILIRVSKLEQGCAVAVLGRVTSHDGTLPKWAAVIEYDDTKFMGPF